METKEIIQRLKVIDDWLEQGDRDIAHQFIIKLLEGLRETGR